MTLGASGCNQCVGPVGVVTGSSECDQWVWSVGGVYTVYLIMKYPYSSCVCAFWHISTKFRKVTKKRN